MAYFIIIIFNNTIFINICQYLINIGNPNPCLLRFRLAAGAFLFFEKGRAFFEKARFWVPKSCLLRFRLAAGAFCFLFLDMPLFLIHDLVIVCHLVSIVCQYGSICCPISVNICQCTVLCTYLPTIRYCVLYGTFIQCTHECLIQPECTLWIAYIGPY